MKWPKILDPEKISSFFLRLSLREKIFLGGALLMVVLVFSDQLVIRPTTQTFNSLNQQINNLQADIKKSVRLLSQKERILQELKEYAIYSTQHRSPEEETVALLKHIEELANRTNVNLLYVKPAAAKTEAKETKYYATLECEGPMEQIVTFFYEVENSNLLLKIEKYTLRPASKGSLVVKLAATISRPVLR